MVTLESLAGGNHIWLLLPWSNLDSVICQILVKIVKKDRCMIMI